MMPLFSFWGLLLEIVIEHFEICLGMETGRAFFRGALALVDITAIAAFPFGLSLFLEDRTVLYVLHERQIALFVVLLHFGDLSPGNGDILESFLFRYVSEGRIEQGVLFILAGGGGFEVFHRGAYDAGRVGGVDFHHSAFEKLEKALGMLFLVLGGFKEYRRDLLISLFFSL